MSKAKCFMAVILIAITAQLVSNAAPSRASEIQLPYQDYALPVDTRVADLLSRMTLEEKASLLNSGAAAIPRFGIKPYHYGSEALHGVMGPGKFTVFPQAVALASTWDPDFIMKVTTAISDEARAAINQDSKEKGYPGERWLSFWSPTINMARDPRWGRTPETYGEDPYLTSRIGIAFVKGLQGNDPRYIKAVASPKHFAANNEEHNRFRCNAKISERSLREYYLPSFKALIQEGGAESVMAAYNAINGIPCNANEWLLTEVLRNEWGFNGYVVTDCDAIDAMIDRHKYAKDAMEASAFAINAGVDVECGGNALITKNIIAALNKGLVSEAAIDQAVTRLLRARFRLGMFDPPEIVPYTRIPAGVIGSEKHSNLALQASRESIVLLKNDKINGKPLLPLDKNKIKTIAVVGFTADVVQFGDYTGTPVNEPVTTLGGVNNKLGKQTEIRYTKWNPIPGIDDYAAVPASALRPAGGAGAGLKAEYFANADFKGAPVLTRTEDGVNLSGSSVPASIKERSSFSVRWTGKLTSKMTGAHYMYFATSGAARVLLDGKSVIEKQEAEKKKKPALKAGAALSSYTMDQQGEKRKNSLVMLEAGKSYDITVEFTPSKGDTAARLEWVPPTAETAAERAKEFKDIKTSDAVIAVMGLQRFLEHENIDRIDMDVPFEQTEYVRELMKLNQNVVVVLINGSPLSINWIKANVPAIVEAWYPGEQGGNAIADVLFGDYNPGGRLPFTFYKSVDDLPAFDNYEISNGRTYMYFDKEPLFPFGYGLSYTSFEYGNLKIDDKNPKVSGFINVSFDVKNTGGRAGDEVVQLYIRDVESSVKQPKIQLKAFKRISLGKGETQTVLFRLAVADFNYWDVNAKKYVVEPGDFNILAGASSSDIRLKDKITVSSD
ncbi:MAG: glycoside hydrolase family 3 C-terminal domain-containing protein [bacterium]